MAKTRRTEGVGWSLVPPDETAPPPAAATARAGRPRLTLEKRAKGKQVTRLSGLVDLDAGEIDAWLRRLKAACGAGGAAGPDWLELQGDRRDALRAAARQRGLEV